MKENEMELIFRRIVIGSMLACVVGQNSYSLNILRRDGSSGDFFDYEGGGEVSCQEFGGSPLPPEAPYQCQCGTGASIATNFDSQTGMPTCYRDARLIGKGCARDIYQMELSESTALGALTCKVSRVLVWEGRFWQDHTDLILMVASADILLDESELVVRVASQIPSIVESSVSGHVVKMEARCGTSDRCLIAKAIGERKYSNLLFYPTQTTTSSGALKTPTLFSTPTKLSSTSNGLSTSSTGTKLASTTLRQTDLPTTARLSSTSSTTAPRRITISPTSSTRFSSTSTTSTANVTPSSANQGIQTTPGKTSTRPVSLTSASSSLTVAITLTTVAKTTETQQTKPSASGFSTSPKSSPSTPTVVPTENPGRSHASVNTTTVVAAVVPTVCCLVLIIVIALICTKRNHRKKLTGGEQVKEVVENTYASVSADISKSADIGDKKYASGSNVVSQPIYFAADHENFYHQVDTPAGYAVAEQPDYRELEENYYKDSAKNLQQSCDSGSQYETLKIDDLKNLYELPRSQSFTVI